LVYKWEGTFINQSYLGDKFNKIIFNIVTLSYRHDNKYFNNDTYINVDNYFWTFNYFIIKDKNSKFKESTKQSKYDSYKTYYKFQKLSKFIKLLHIKN